MKKVLLFLLLPILVFSQERENRESLKFKKTIGTLEKAIGWGYNDATGDWVDYQNMIENDAQWKRGDSNVPSTFMMSHIEQNFIKLEFRTLVYENETYYILFVTKWSGLYNYPTIKEDWIKYKVLEGYVFTEEQFNQLKNIEEKVELSTNLQISSSIQTNFMDANPLDRLQYVLNPEYKQTHSKYRFPVIVSEKGNIRFFVPDRISTYKPQEQFLFKKQYFEVSREIFNKLLGI